MFDRSFDFLIFTFRSCLPERIYRCLDGHHFQRGLVIVRRGERWEEDRGKPEVDQGHGRAFDMWHVTNVFSSSESGREVWYHSLASNDQLHLGDNQNQRKLAHNLLSRIIIMNSLSHKSTKRLYKQHRDKLRHRQSRIAKDWKDDDRVVLMEGMHLWTRISLFLSEKRCSTCYLSPSRQRSPQILSHPLGSNPDESSVIWSLRVDTILHT